MTLSQINEMQVFMNALITYGPMGLMLAWLLMRGERKMEMIVDRLDRLSHRINGITKAMLMDVVSRENHHNEKARELAQRMLGQMESSEPETGKPTS